MGVETVVGVGGNTGVGVDAVVGAGVGTAVAVGFGVAVFDGTADGSNVGKTVGPMVRPGNVVVVTSGVVGVGAGEVGVGPVPRTVTANMLSWFTKAAAVEAPMSTLVSS